LPLFTETQMPMLREEVGMHDARSNQEIRGLSGFLPISGKQKIR